MDLQDSTRRNYDAMGRVSALGAFNYVFLNGDLLGFYNTTERLGDDFMRARHGGDNDWDVIRQTSVAADGDTVEWNGFLDFMRNTDLSVGADYIEAGNRLDIPDFIDYLLTIIYGAVLDWPGANWTAAREKVTGAKWRFYV